MEWAIVIFAVVALLAVVLSRVKKGSHPSAAPMVDDCLFAMKLMRTALARLSWPAAEQSGWLEKHQWHVDELGLDFDNAYRTLRHDGECRQRFCVDENQTSLWDALNDMLDRMSGAENREFWTPEGLRERLEWEQVRKTAREALAFFQTEELERLLRRSHKNYIQLPLNALIKAMGLLLLAISAFLTWGVLFVPRQAGDPEVNMFFVVLLLLVLYSLSLSCLASWSRRSQARRVKAVSFHFACFGLWLYLIIITINEIATKGERAALRPGTATFWVVPLLFIPAVGLFMYFRIKKKFRGDDRDQMPLLLILSWPLAVFARSILIGTVTFAAFFATVFLGETIGARFGRPLSGALCGLALLAAGLGVRHLFSKRKPGGMI